MVWDAVMFLLLCTVVLCLSNILGNTNRLQWGKRIQYHNSQFLFDQSLENCFKECGSRQECVSFHYYPKGNWCYLNGRSKGDGQTNLEEIPGFVHSIRDDWRQDVEFPCKFHEVSGAQPCFVTECSNPKSPENGLILGNTKSVGSRLKYLCYRGKKIAGSYISTCLINGSWSAENTDVCDRKGACPVQYELYGSFRYKICETCENWTRSREICQEDGGDLLTLHTDDEFEYLLRVTKTSKKANCETHSFWVGASDERYEGKWIWVNGEQLSVTDPHWKKGHPNNRNGKQHCLAIAESYEGMKINDLKCEVARQFICKYSAV